MAVVYLHKRNDTNEVFYVGIGKTPRRAYRKDNRNPHWKHIVNKVGYTVDILVSETPWEDACKIEKLLIEKYGRKDLGLGNLVNMTDGGDGSINPSIETRQKNSEAQKGEKNAMFGKPGTNLGKKFTEEHKQKIRESNTGKTHTEETRQKLSEAAKGRTLSETAKQKVSLFNRNKEGVKGFSFHKASKKYKARIKVGGKDTHLGLYNTPEEAELAYKQAKLKYHI